MDRSAEQLDSSDVVGRNGSARRLARRVLVATVGLLGILAVHHPMILSGFSRIQTELGDSRLLNYLLEHGWLWLRGTPGHERFWDAPFFHPVKNVIAYTDSMFSYGPFYWPFRLIGFSPEVAFGLFLITATALNYAAGVLLFRRGLGFGAPATSAAAGLLAFGSPRVNQMLHAQLVPFFYLLLALYALCRIIRDDAASAAERAVLWIVFSLAVAAQFYGGVYLGWFFGVGLAAATATALALRTSRDGVVSLIRRDWWAATLAAGIGALVLIPFLDHYLPAAREFGGTFNSVQIYGHPTSWSWWNVGPNNWIWGWIDRRWPIGAHPFPWELRLGLGFLTTAACAGGLYLGRRSPLGGVALATTVLGLLGMTLVPNDQVVLLAAAVICFVFGSLFREPDWSERGLGSFALAVVVLLACPPYNDVVRALTLVLMAFCGIRLWRRRGRADALLAPGTALGLLALHLLPWATMSLIAPGAVALGLILGYFQPRRRTEFIIGVAGLFLVAVAWLAFESRPEIFRNAVLGLGFGWATSRLPRRRPTPKWLFRILAASFAIVFLLHGSSSVWYAVSPYLPGASAIRVPARAALILLIPAAFGLAALVERLDRGRWAAAAWCVVLLCLVEQGATTDTYELAESRARIASISRRIDPAAESFYYRPEPAHEDGFTLFNLDAMWASLAVGIPTINGNSGCFPRDWWPLPQADAPNQPTTEQALRGWCEKTGLDRRRVQRIGRGAETGADEVVPAVSDPVR